MLDHDDALLVHRVEQALRAAGQLDEGGRTGLAGIVPAQTERRAEIRRALGAQVGRSLVAGHKRRDELRRAQPGAVRILAVDEIEGAPTLLRRHAIEPSGAAAGSPGGAEAAIHSRAGERSIGCRPS